MKKAYPPAIALLVSCCLVSGSLAQFNKRHLPPPIKVLIPFENTWQAVLETLTEEGLVVSGEDRARGRIVSNYREYISGPLTKEHLAKIGDRPKLIDANWVKARYRHQIVIHFITDKETVVMVNSDIEGQKRDFLAQESWVEIGSNGKLETQFLTSFGKRVFGDNFVLAQPKKGFWEHDPTFVPEPTQRVPKIAAPERPPNR